MKVYTDFVFDIDGTLLDTERTGVLSLMQTIRELTGREVSYDRPTTFSEFRAPRPPRRWATPTKTVSPKSGRNISRN